LRAQKKSCKRKGHLAGALVARNLNVRATRAWCAPDDAITASDAARRASMRASDFVSEKFFCRLNAADFFLLN